MLLRGLHDVRMWLVVVSRTENCLVLLVTVDTLQLPLGFPTMTEGGYGLSSAGIFWHNPCI